MLTTIALSLAALIATAVIFIGANYLVAPHRISGSFGLRPPSPDPDTRAWLRLKGIRDISSGLVILTLMLTTSRRTVGIALLAFSIVAFGDMSIVLTSGGKRSAAFSIHGLTCAVMIAVGLILTLLP